MKKLLAVLLSVLIIIGLGTTVAAKDSPTAQPDVNIEGGSEENGVSKKVLADNEWVEVADDPSKVLSDEKAEDLEDAQSETTPLIVKASSDTGIAQSDLSVSTVFDVTHYYDDGELDVLEGIGADIKLVSDKFKNVVGVYHWNADTAQWEQVPSSQTDGASFWYTYDAATNSITLHSNVTSPFAVVVKSATSSNSSESYTPVNTSEGE